MPPRLPTRRRRLAALAAALLVAGLAAAGAWLWTNARTSTPVSAEDALADFREAAGGRGEGREGVPAEGVYTYRQRGSERGGAGPVSVERELPAEARYIVTHVPGGYREELVLSGEHTEEVRLRVDGEGARAVRRRTEVTFGGIGRDDRRALRPPPLRRPARPAVGSAWGGSYRAGELPVEYRSRALRLEEVDVGGEEVPAVVLRTVGDTGGAHPGTRVDTVWWAPGPALPVRWRIEMEIRGTLSLRTRADLELVGLTPAR